MTRAHLAELTALSVLIFSAPAQPGRAGEPQYDYCELGDLPEKKSFTPGAGADVIFLTPPQVATSPSREGKRTDIFEQRQSNDTRGSRSDRL